MPSGELPIVNLRQKLRDLAPCFLFCFRDGESLMKVLQAHTDHWSWERWFGWEEHLH